MSEEYYLQHPSEQPLKCLSPYSEDTVFWVVGDKDNHLTHSLDEAKVYTKQEARLEVTSHPHLTPWPKEYVDDRSKRMVLKFLINHSEAMLEDL